MSVLYDTTSPEALPALPRKGRGSVSNRPSSRFDAADRYDIDDGWSDHDREEWARERRPTILGIDTARHVITRNTSPDIGFDRSINPYKGCEHGCIYCFARPTHAYLDLSPGMDFETRIFRKPDAAARLREELSARNYKPAPLMLGINTDAYQPTEKSERLTRSLLEVMYEFRHPVNIVTKSALILRDLDILAPMARENLFKACLSITTLDRDLARVMEPRAATPSKRLDTIRGLHEAGIPVSVLAAPVIPGLACHELEAILKASAEAGAYRAGFTLVRLPHEVKDLFEEWLRTHVPDRADKVLNLIRQTRGGKLYTAEFGKRMTGTGVYADMIHKRFSLAVKRYGLDKPSRPMDFSRFRGGDPQMTLF
ncbi:PA0069 family radical SAM protein [Asticcacaulis sp. 201]|uniref:PA0069 family radical SAM protein n=1 Tax=Asticcacaulis sp. 201 TaxID=3028787 RepID=UPI00291642E8|nr:PA0069 family radical SAM protein [Asticcacaulis sp. 201]MDV6331739.1 PA0069 family radical SAM protein [Asticcacaulis sp. 201]